MTAMFPSTPASHFFLSALDYIPPPPASLLCRCISSVNGGGSTPGIPAHPNENIVKTAKANIVFISFFTPIHLHFLL
jgi:hypothetical protein